MYFVDVYVRRGGKQEKFGRCPYDVGGVMDWL